MVLQPAIGFKELSHKLSQKRRSSVWNIRKARLSTPLLVSRPQVEWTLQKSYRFNNYFLLQKLPLRRFLLIISNAWQGLSSNTKHFIFGALQKAKEKRGVPHFGPFKSKVVVITKVDKDFSFFFIGLLKIPSCFIKHLLGPWSGSLITRYYYIIYQLLSKTSDGPKKNSFVKLVQQLSEEMIKSGPKGKNQLFESICIAFHRCCCRPSDKISERLISFRK